MKKIKLASLILFGLMAIACEKSLAQTDQNTQQTTTDPNAVAPDNSGTTQPATDPNVSSDPQNVTIDSTAAPASTTTTESTSAPVKSESTTKIHIYSGKHDGNNVINPDPKN
ncbi:MAG TPA: hypothetical protein VJY62_08480 [Bacteroidia bacterium]|nr:hypothetical protein [Bacteroidia bacterium]